MASKLLGPGWYAVLTQDIDLDADTFKLMLVDETYAPSTNQALIDDGTADDAASHEITATNYAPGFAGAGRKTVALTHQYSSGGSRIEIAIPDTTWTALGGAANDTVGGVVLYKHLTNDGASIPLAFFDFADFTTNGGDFTLNFLALGAGGNIRWTP